MFGTEAFPNLGRHCSEVTCRQLDFLPFKCEGCRKIFCLDHRTFASHHCDKSNVHDVQVVICPECGKSVKNSPNRTLESCLQSHQDYECKHQLELEVPVCAVKGCKEKLTFSNKVECKSCAGQFCLRHRHNLDHNCSSLSSKKTQSKSPRNLFLNAFNCRENWAAKSSTSKQEDLKTTNLVGIK